MGSFCVPRPSDELRTVEQVVGARRLVAGEAHRVGNLREVPDFVHHDVRGELAARHGDGVAIVDAERQHFAWDAVRKNKQTGVFERT